MFHVVFYSPKIAGNTGNAIRLSAVTGATLHLIEPLGFNFSDSHLKRAGLDYHDLADVKIHPDLETAFSALPGRIFAFTGQATGYFADVSYQAGDALLFGPEPDGLPEDIMAHPRVTQRVRIPMLAGRRSLNLANSAAIAVYEAWRQHGYANGV